MSDGGPINLAQREDASAQVQVLNARSHLHATNWAFVALVITLAGGLLAFIWLDVAGHDTGPLREWLQTTVAGEIGLIAGLFGSKHTA